MSLLQAAVLGMVQGLTEFLPVSSSGHLILVPKLFGWPAQDVAFDAIIHLATLAAILFGLFPDIVLIVKGMCVPPSFLRRDKRGVNLYSRLGWSIVLATVPILTIGFLFKDVIETTLRSPLVVAFSLAFWGILLFAADRFVKPQAESDVASVGWKRAFAIGAAQAIALIPGTSRSGVTITAGLFSGLNRETAARFSFLLGIPAIAAAGSAAVLDLLNGNVHLDLLSLLVGFAAAFVSGIFAIRFLLKILKTGTYKWFGVYRIALAVIVLFLFLR